KLGDYTQVEKLDLTSKDILSDNIAKIGQLFPEVLTESSDENGRLRPAIDFDKLRQFLSREIVEGRESYEFTWVGKRGAIAEAGKPTTQTLRPDLEESVDFDKSENVFITGDNLEVLKVLQESYLGKIDMIYIDPPYNTGKAFVYSDKFQMSEEELADEMDLRDENGLQRVGLTKNEKSSARYHSDWLNMMYPRLVLARNLLKDSGVIFISIDDNEQANLKAICDEIFGEENFVNIISVNSKVSAGASGGGEDKKLKKNIEYVLMYSKDIYRLNVAPIYKKTELMDYIAKMKSDKKSFKYTNVLYKIDDVKYFTTIKDGSGNDIVINKVNKYDIKTVKQVSEIEKISINQVYIKYYNQIMTTTNAQTSIRTRVWNATDDENNMYIATYTPQSGKNRGKKVDLIFIGKQKVLVIWLKDSSELSEDKIYKKEQIGTFWDGFSWINVSKEGNIKFENGKKPISFIQRFIDMCPKQDMICLDFFAGSSSTAHAVLQKNAQDGGYRKFIMCTLDENAEGNNEFGTIDQLSRERIRRAAKKIQEEFPETVGKQDFGFRAYKLDSSNFKEVSQTPDSFSQESLFDSVSNIKDGRTDLDLLFQIMLTWGMELSLPIEKTQIDGTAVYNVADGALIACFADEISESVLRQIAKEEPLRAVFKDESFANSAAKINLGQIFKEEAPNTKVKVV
ncbi:TPA: site-specific DNA-methyltransferase, partial [Streptococcus suis]